MLVVLGVREVDEYVKVDQTSLYLLDTTARPG